MPSFLPVSRRCAGPVNYGSREGNDLFHKNRSLSISTDPFGLQWLAKVFQQIPWKFVVHAVVKHIWEFYRYCMIKRWWNLKSIWRCVRGSFCRILTANTYFYTFWRNKGGWFFGNFFIKIFRNLHTTFIKYTYELRVVPHVFQICFRIFTDIIQILLKC